MALKWPIMCWCAVKKLLTHLCPLLFFLNFWFFGHCHVMSYWELPEVCISILIVYTVIPSRVFLWYKIWTQWGLVVLSLDSLSLCPNLITCLMSSDGSLLPVCCRWVYGMYWYPLFPSSAEWASLSLASAAFVFVVRCEFNRFSFVCHTIQEFF